MNAQIEAAAAALAAAEEELSEADALFRARADELATIQSRLTDAVNKRVELIAAARAKPDDMPLHGQIAVIEQDVADLQHLRDEAERAAEEAKPDRQHQAVGAAMHRLDQAKTQVAFTEMEKHVADCDQALCTAVGRLHNLGLTLGRPRELAAVWKPSETLHRAMHHRVPPPA